MYVWAVWHGGAAHFGNGGKCAKHVRPGAGNGGGQYGGGAMAGMETGECVNGLYAVHGIRPIAAMHMAINKAG
jgi:hypothetical protein